MRNHLATQSQRCPSARQMLPDTSYRCKTQITWHCATYVLTPTRMHEQHACTCRAISTFALFCQLAFVHLSALKEPQERLLGLTVPLSHVRIIPKRFQCMQGMPLPGEESIEEKKGLRDGTKIMVGVLVSAAVLLAALIAGYLCCMRRNAKTKGRKETAVDASNPKQMVRFCFRPTPGVSSFRTPECFRV